MGSMADMLLGYALSKQEAQGVCLSLIAQSINMTGDIEEIKRHIREFNEAFPCPVISAQVGEWKR